MSVWNNIKKMFSFSSDIGVTEDISGYAIFPLKLKGGKLKLNKKLIVPENFSLVVVSEGKALDSFPAGEHMLGVVSLPEASKKFKLYKPDSSGNPINEFPCSAYYVNLLEQKHVAYAIDKKLKYKTTIDGRYWVKPKGRLSYIATDPKLFIETVLNEMPKFKILKLDKTLHAIFTERLVDSFKQDNYYLASFKQNLEYLDDNILPKVNKMLSKNGVEITKINFQEIEFSKSADRVEAIRQQRAEQAEIQKEEDNEEKRLQSIKKAEATGEMWWGLEKQPIGEIDLHANELQSDVNQIRAQCGLPEINNQSEEIQEVEKTIVTPPAPATWGGWEEVNKSIQSKKFVDLDEDYTK